MEVRPATPSDRGTRAGTPNSLSKKINPEEYIRQIGSSGDVTPDVEVLSTNPDLYVNTSGKLKRTLKSRHMQMLALGGTIGTGLFIGSGSALNSAGPVGALLGYAFVGLVIFSIMVSLGEMTTLFPVAGGFTHFASRFCDDALGFAQGINYWYSWAITTPLEITAAAIVVAYWDPDTNVAVYISVFFVLICLVNYFGTRAYGEAEFWLSFIKVTAITGLIILGIVLFFGGGPNHDRIGFRYWKTPGPFAQYNNIEGAWGRFLAFWSTFINAAFAYTGTELVAVTAAEAENPRRNVPKAIKRVFWRIIFFYLGSILVIGLLVPFDSEELLNVIGGAADASSSPFVIFINNANIPVLPHIINAVILVAVVSAGNSDLYAASRTLYALALEEMVPGFVARVSKRGLPYVAVTITASIGLLAYLNVSNSAGVVFNWFINISTISILITWLIVQVCYLRFFYAMKLQGYNRDLLPYKAPFQPYTAWFGLIAISIILFFNGFSVFLDGNWDTSVFITSYVGIPIYICLYLFWKVTKRTKWKKLSEIDLVSGRVGDPEIEMREDMAPTTWWGKAWEKIM
ncbi:hypothetical protein YB2330_000135 [Saitoella coloradoensis]